MFRYSDYYRQIFTRLRKKMFRHRDCYGQTVTRLRNNYCFAADVVIVRLLLVLATITTKVSPQRLLSSDFYSSWEKLFRYRDWNRHFFFLLVFSFVTDTVIDQAEIVICGHVRLWIKFIVCWNRNLPAGSSITSALNKRYNKQIINKHFIKVRNST